ncbi:hypothetical protein M0805_007825 [Coniferiporia weirii]|nr:hypothetical protein M0805_007825 [Coniferiporia weirii]
MEGVSTLPGLKDLFPEHFFQHPDQAMSPPPLGAHLPPSLSHPQVHPQQPQPQAQHQYQHQHHAQYQHEQAFHGPYGHTYEPQPAAHGVKRPYEAVHGRPGPYFFAPDGALGNGAPNMGMNVHMSPGGGVYTAGDDGMEEGEDGDADVDYAEGDAEKRRHPCAQCGKRFNRPSSLKIHLNTHTGAKPFVCPFPGCGRSFNVSSNMRRHHRNHARRPPPPSDAYAAALERGRRGFAYGQHQRDLQHQNTQNHIQRGRESAYADAIHSQLYSRRSDVRTRSGSGSNSGSGSLHPLGPVTPPYTNEGSEPGTDYERTDNVHFDGHSVFGYTSDVRPYDNAYGDPFSGPYGGYGAGPLGPLYHQPPNATMSMPVPAHIPFPVDPALAAQSLGGGVGGTIVSGDANGNEHGYAEAFPGYAGAPLHSRNRDPGVDGHGPENLRWRLPTLATSDARSSVPANADNAYGMQNAGRGHARGRGRGRATSRSSRGAHPTHTQGLQFRSILVPMNGDPAHAQQAHGHGYGRPLEQQPSPDTPSMHTHALPPADGTGENNRGSRGAKGPAPAPHALAHPQSNARASRSSMNSDTDSGGASVGNGNGSATPGAAPAPPYPLYTYPPPSLSAIDPALREEGDAATEGKAPVPKPSKSVNGGEAEVNSTSPRETRSVRSSVRSRSTTATVTAAPVESKDASESESGDGSDFDEIEGDEGGEGEDDDDDDEYGVSKSTRARKRQRVDKVMRVPMRRTRSSASKA